ncbi:hypothetical protein [Streptomyces canus]|uniref:hypothetical protein n=1 Tax=Streptomyces canus TaxID=58343 RepID=UPI002259AC49|nr:hypothetical protein [Streptomyces canus]MCX4861227.1 hypothetical protein [Streptomyces canus]
MTQIGRSEADTDERGALPRSTPSLYRAGARAESLGPAGDRIRGDRVLHEALTAGADPLHLALVVNLSHTTASRYAAIAQNLLDDQIEQTARNE